MKARTIMTAAVLIMTLQFANATEPTLKFNSPEKKISFASKNLLAAIRSENPGVIESAIRVTAQMKMRYPEADVTTLVKAMEDVWLKNPSGALRYKAYIASNICTDPDWYSNDLRTANADDDDFFKAASSRMQEKLLSTNSF